MSALLVKCAVACGASLTLGSAVGVIWTKHESRSAFVDLQRLQAERDELDIEWGRMKLEQSTWSSHGRVEQVARANLKMIIPQPNAVIPVGDSGDQSHVQVLNRQ